MKIMNMKILNQKKSIIEKYNMVIKQTKEIVFYTNWVTITIRIIQMTLLMDGKKRYSKNEQMKRTFL